MTPGIRNLPVSIPGVIFCPVPITNKDQTRRLSSSVASLSRWLLVGSRRTIQGGRLLRSAAVADQQDGDGHEHRVPIAVEAVVAAAASQVNPQSGVQQQPMILQERVRRSQCT